MEVPIFKTADVTLDHLTGLSINRFKFQARNPKPLKPRFRTWMSQGILPSIISRNVTKHVGHPDHRSQQAATFCWELSCSYLHSLDMAASSKRVCAPHRQVVLRPGNLEDLVEALHQPHALDRPKCPSGPITERSWTLTLKHKLKIESTATEPQKPHRETSPLPPIYLPIQADLPDCARTCEDVCVCIYVYIYIYIYIHMCICVYLTTCVCTYACVNIKLNLCTGTWYIYI